MGMKAYCPKCGTDFKKGPDGTYLRPFVWMCGCIAIGQVITWNDDVPIQIESNKSKGDIREACRD